MAALERLLIAEDNPALLSVVRFNLQRVGYQVTTARNGREAWQLLQVNQYDLLITDHQMPELNGADLCRMMREHPNCAATPVIMLTAKGLELELESLRQQWGVVAVIAKPFSPIGLLQTVRDYLDRIAVVA